MHRLLLSSGGRLLSQFDGNFLSRGALSNGAWHEVVFVYDSKAGTVSYYIDGAFDSSAAVRASLAGFTAPFYAGQYGTGTNYKWKGRLGQFIVYPAALSADRIAAHYHAAGY